MATQKEILEQDLAEELAEAGPDSPLVKHLRAQIASLETIRPSSMQSERNSAQQDRYHGATLNKQGSASPDPMLAAHNGLERALRKQAQKYLATAQPPQAQSPSKDSTTPPPSEAS